MYQKQGFTLIELLVVVLIIGILSAVALPQYRKAVLKARAAEGITLLRAVAQAEDVYFLANGQYTKDLESLDLELPKFTCPDHYCNFSVSGTFLWEINFSSGFTAYKTYCAAPDDDAAANQICASYGEYTHRGNNLNYYCILTK